MEPAATLVTMTDKLLRLQALGAHGPVILVAEPYSSFNAVEILASELQAAGFRLHPHIADPVRRESWSLTSSENQVILLHGLEYLTDAALTAQLKTLNRRRDELSHQTGLTILWLPETLVPHFTRHCPDLFAWRELMTRVQVPVPQERRAHLQLVACLLRSGPDEQSASHLATAFTPAEQGPEAFPRSLPWILANTSFPWLVASDFPSALTTLWTLAHARAREFLSTLAADTPLIVPVPVSAPLSLRSAMADAGLGPLTAPLSSMGGADSLSVVLLLPEVLPPVSELTELVEVQPGPRFAVMCRTAPTVLPNGFRRFDSVTDYVLGNHQLVRHAGLPEAELNRIERLGLLTLPSDYLHRLLSVRERLGELPADDLGVLEHVLDEPRQPTAERQALDELCAQSDRSSQQMPSTALLQHMRAARCLLDSNWIEVLFDSGLLTPECKQTMQAILSLSLPRRLRIYGPEALIEDIESIAARLGEAPSRTALLLVASDSFSSYVRYSPVPEALSARANALFGTTSHPLAVFPDRQSGRQRRTEQRGSHMDSAARKLLSTTLRALRARLLTDLHTATESTYRLSIQALHDAGLDEAARTRRQRLQDWIAEQLRTQETVKGKAKPARDAEAFRLEAEKQAAYTLLNRLVMLRLMESTSPPLRTPALITGGWESRAYKDFRDLAPDLCQRSGRFDETEGYAFLLRLTFEELAIDLPGLFGPAGVADLIPIPPATLRFAIDALNAPALESCWSDDMTLGWVYQYWNDPEREALDDKLNAGGKVEPHELASKTQMFTERYMVDWLLHNSLGPLWLALCQKHGWTPEVQADGTLERLETRRQAWRAKRAAGEVSLTDLMPLLTDGEQRWAYFLPQPLPADASALAPDSLRDLKLLDPAVGSGHFLVAALGLLVPLYQEEARHRGRQGQSPWTTREIVERILSHNLHGIDLDPRAVQIAAAALWLKARRLAPDAHPERLNLVASQLRLARLAEDDPALLELQQEVTREIGIPESLTQTLVRALNGADHLGSLLKVNAAVDEAMRAYEAVVGKTDAQQLTMFGTPRPQQTRIDFDALQQKRLSLEARLEQFLAQHSAGDDLGLRLRGEQLASGVRFVRLMREGQYELVVANPPYQGTSKLADSQYIEKTYPLGKADLFAAFLLRGLELVRPGGISAMLTMRNWMFIKQYAGLRQHLLEKHGLLALGDFDRGAFEDVPDEVVSVAVSAFVRGKPITQSLAHCPTPREDHSRDADRTQRKRAATLCQEGRYSFDPAALKVVPEWPLVYWWDQRMLELYQSAPLIGTVAPARQGLATADNARFLRKPWETDPISDSWYPFIKGAEGRVWIEPLNEVMNWAQAGIEMQSFQRAVLRNPEYYFHRGVAFSMIGAEFSARVHRFPSIFGNKGSSVFPADLASAVCAMNSQRARDILASLNPGIGFEVGDVNRLPLFPIESADAIYARIEAAFTVHESHREPSVEFKRPGPSPWRYAQAWAQEAVDRPAGAPLPVYAEELDPEPPTDHLSFALGVALGRFGAAEGPTEGIRAAGIRAAGIRDPATDDLSDALPHGILFLDQTLEAQDLRDGLGHEAASVLHQAWSQHAPALGVKRSLREWLAVDFFKDIHRGMYENRPIHWPLSSSNKTFVAWVNIHRLTAQTLRILQADHLLPTLARLDGTLKDLRDVRDGSDARAAKAAERPLERLLKARDELQAFMTAVEQCAEKGPPPTDAKCPPREQDARYQPDLDDGVMINASALWPLLEPQWKDPKKWWKELATAEGRKDYDWSHLAACYWPTRVDQKCQQDPSLGVAHGCFWRYHPARAFAWELRLQDEIGPDFVLHEKPYRGDGGDEVQRATFLASQPGQALEAIEKEVLRRRRKTRQPVHSLRLLWSGLWSAVPEQVWALELSLLEKQGAECLILSPDEVEGRLAYVRAHADAEARRAHLREAHQGQLVLLGEEEEEVEEGEKGEENE